MIDVDVFISGIIMCCEDRIAEVNIGNGYSVEKMYFDQLPFKDKVIDGHGHLNTSYYGSRLNDEHGVYFMCITKTDTFQIHGPHFTGGVQVFTDVQLGCGEELTAYMDEEMKYLNQTINLLRLYKAGNIGFQDVFLNFKFKMLGFIDSTQNHNSHSQTRNIVDSRKWELSTHEVCDCNQFLASYQGMPYGLIESSIDEFSWGLEQMDIPTGLEQFTTALEMTLLEQNQRGKKQVLANRVAVMLGTDDNSIQSYHQKMIQYYRVRSESLHEGGANNVTEMEFRELGQHRAIQIKMTANTFDSQYSVEDSTFL